MATGAAVLAYERAWLGYSGRVESDQYFRAPIRIPDAVRADVRAGAEDSRPNTKSLWPQPRWAIRAFAAGGRRYQNVDQGRHRPRALGPPCALPGSNSHCRCGD